MTADPSHPVITFGESRRDSERRRVQDIIVGDVTVGTLIHIRDRPGRSRVIVDSDAAPYRLFPKFGDLHDTSHLTERPIITALTEDRIRAMKRWGLITEPEDDGASR